MYCVNLSNAGKKLGRLENIREKLGNTTSDPFKATTRISGGVVWCRGLATSR